MMFLRVCVTLCSLATLSMAGPINSTGPSHTGRCQYMKEMGKHSGGGGFVPECDSEGNFIPKQCCSTTGFCWCVDIITGEEILRTRGAQADYYYDCVKPHYCPEYWFQWGSQCFIYIDAPKSWIEADKYCEFNGGNLASVHSYNEYHAIQDLSRGNTHEFSLAWLGAHDAVMDGVWMWADGTKFDYKNWYMDEEPNGPGNCLMMNYGYDWKWYNADCNKSLPFVCSKSYTYYR